MRQKVKGQTDQLQRTQLGIAEEEGKGGGEKFSSIKFALFLSSHRYFFLFSSSSCVKYPC